MSAHFFGYGSLVNTATHDFGGTRTTLHGWRRVWRPTPFREAAFLSAEPDREVSIQGLRAPVPAGSWADLDKREHHYDRIDISDTLGTTTVIYSVPDTNHASSSKPIWLSYLDVVLQGFLHQFGPEGPQAFMETTSGWENGILDDRAAPKYPRAQILTDAETALVNSLIAPYRR